MGWSRMRLLVQDNVDFAFRQSIQTVKEMLLLNTFINKVRQE